MPSNFATAITAREYYSIHGNFGEPLPGWEHTPPGDKPPPPDISSLSSEEQTAINNWMAQVDLGSGRNPEGLSEDGQTAVAAYIEYFNTAAYNAWRFSNLLERIAQWRWVNADAHDRAAAALAKSADATGAGSGAGTAAVPTSTN